MAMLALVKQIAGGVAYCLRCWALATGGLMLATQLVSRAGFLAHRPDPGLAQDTRTRAQRA